MRRSFRIMVSAVVAIFLVLLATAALEASRRYILHANLDDMDGICRACIDPGGVDGCLTEFNIKRQDCISAARDNASMGYSEWIPGNGD